VKQLRDFTHVLQGRTAHDRYVPRDDPRERDAAGAAPVETAARGQNIMQVTEIASAGNGGVATSSANGGAVSIGDVNSGGNAGNAIGVGDTWGGSVGVDGGSVANSTQLNIAANGGTAIADASGGDYNLAFVS
jgi:hypothetical protein